MDSSFKEDNVRDTETVICRSRPENERGCTIIFVILIMVGVSIFGATITGEVIVFFGAMFIWLIPYYLLTSELMWQFSGEETVSITHNYLIIRRKHKLFRKGKRILLSNIREVDRWKPSFVRNSFEATSPAGNSQWTLCIIDNTSFPYQFGPCLSEEEQERVIAAIETAVKRTKEEMWEVRQN